MNKKIAGFLVVLLLATTGSTCKKSISKYPFNMYGVWYDGDTMCGTVLVIERSGEGKLFSQGGSFCSFDTDVKGTVKYKKDVLYIGSKKYTIFNDPQLDNGNDSIVAPDENNFTTGKTSTRRVLATMKLQEKGILTFAQTFNFSKYVDF